MLQCEDVQAWECACDYGLPSGHSSIAIVNSYIAADAIMTSLKKKYKSQKKGGLNPEQVESKFAWIRIVGWVIAFFIGFSRIVLGVHSWNQVLLGFSIGILCKDWFNEEVWRTCLLWVGL